MRYRPSSSTPSRRPTSEPVNTDDKQDKDKRRSHGVFGFLKKKKDKDSKKDKDRATHVWPLF